ncbi:MAG: glycosyltransferase family 9 protein [Planctomycetes bacterium]|nr:glycosyltransferase family 9 protein [Planctomycetota bacterium]
MAWTAPDEPITRLLIVMPSWVGDTVMATPFLSALRDIPAFADSHITAYLRPGLNDLLSGQPEIDDMIPGRPAGLLGPWRGGRRLAGQSFDAAVLLPNSWRLACTVFLSGIGRRVGYGRDGRSWMLTHAVRCPVAGGWKEPMPAVAYYLNLATYLGATEVAGQARPMRLVCTDEQQESATAILAAEGVAEDEPIALLNPGGNNPAKRWPADRFAALGAWLSSEHGMHVLVNGSPPEADLVQRICSEAAGLAGSATKMIPLTRHRASLGVLKALCDRTRLVITNDTGTRHIAAALGMTQTTNPSHSNPPLGLVTLFGPVAPEWTTLGYDREIEMYDRDSGEVGAIALTAVQSACTKLL